MRTHLAILLVGGALIGGVAVTAAFPFNRSWHEPATGVAGTNRAGGGGIYGTGGRTDHGIKCSHCHVEGDGAISMTVTPSPAFQDVGGDFGYAPGQRYTITVAMVGEHEHPPSGGVGDKNGMAATVEDASGAVAGRFIADAGQDSSACPATNPYPGSPGAVSPAGKTTFLYGDCHGVLPLDHPTQTAWVFDWIAPAAGAGDLTLFIGMVDGNTDGDSSLDDDTTERAVPLREGS